MATRDFDPAEYLTDEETVVAYIQATAEDGDAKFYLKCLSTAMRARVINQLAEATGIDRDKIFEMLADSKPDPAIIAKIQEVFGSRVKEKELAHA